MANFSVVSFDPGGTTGWAVFTADKIVDPQGIATYSNRTWQCGHLEGMHHQALYRFMESSMVQTTHFVMESFEFRNRSRAGLELISKEYIGVANLFGQDRHLKVHYQTASQGKITENSFVKVTNLKRLSLYRPGWKHAMDAYGHMLYYMINTADIMKLDLLQRGWK